MKKTDSELGMTQSIKRRDVIQGCGLAALGLMLPLQHSCDMHENNIQHPTESEYPPTKTGMRGSHTGSFETAHTHAFEGARFNHPVDLDEEYDLIVVGAGISGLTAAYQYRKTFGSQARILLLDNHDDFGGHAKRNEFHQGGEIRLSSGGSTHLEYQRFSAEVRTLLTELGVDLKHLKKGMDFHYGRDKPAIWFDEPTYGKNILVPGFGIFDADAGDIGKIDKFPISHGSRSALKQFYQSTQNILKNKSTSEVQTILYRTSYTDFLLKHVGLPADAVELFVKATDYYWGVQAHSLSVAEAMSSWLPGKHMMGHYAHRLQGSTAEREVAMFPDGNASIARLLVRALISGVTDEHSAADIAMAKFDYTQLDLPESPVRLRLLSTAVRVVNNKKGVAVTYVNQDKPLRINARHCVLACYHTVIPHLCPELPEKQKKAQKHQIKKPMVMTNVLVKNRKVIDNLGISGAYCPGRMHANVWLIQGIQNSGYLPNFDASSAIPLMFAGTIAPPNRKVHLHEQLREARKILLKLTFEDFEREIRVVLDGILGPSGFKVAEDILAITVNRWPHGYAYEVHALWDSPLDRIQHKIARQPMGNIVIANSDAAASAYAHSAIEQALRANKELERIERAKI